MDVESVDVCQRLVLFRTKTTEQFLMIKLTNTTSPATSLP